MRLNLQEFLFSVILSFLARYGSLVSQSNEILASLELNERLLPSVAPILHLPLIFELRMPLRNSLIKLQKVKKQKITTAENYSNTRIALPSAFSFARGSILSNFLELQSSKMISGDNQAEFQEKRKKEDFDESVPQRYAETSGASTLFYIYLHVLLKFGK